MARKYAIYVLKDGEQIGPFSKKELAAKIDAGEVSRTDLAWHDKLTEWQEISTIIPEIPIDAHSSTILDDWHVESLARFGIKPHEGMTQRQAWRLIKDLRDDPKAVAEAEGRKIAMEEEEERNRRFFPSYCLKNDVKEAEKELEDVKKDASSTNEDLEDAKDQLKEAKALRVDFWRATMHKFGVACGDTDILIDYEEAIQALTDEYGRYFKAPPSKAVQDIIDHLDSLDPEWDRTAPHAFYAELKRRSPQATRKAPLPSSKPRRARGSGCFTAFACVAIIAAASIVIPDFYAASEGRKKSQADRIADQEARQIQQKAEEARQEAETLSKYYAPPPKPTEQQEAEELEQYQRDPMLAVRRAKELYPGIDVPGSDLNKAYTRLNIQYRRESPEFFQSPDWPIRLAQEASETAQESAR